MTRLNPDYTPVKVFFSGSCRSYCAWALEPLLISDLILAVLAIGCIRRESAPLLRHTT